jgi:hypothetical protein
VQWHILKDAPSFRYCTVSTRASKLSDVGVRYANICRRLLTALDEVDTLVASRSRRRLARWR